MKEIKLRVNVSITKVDMGEIEIKGKTLNEVRKNWNIYKREIKSYMEKLRKEGII